MKSKFLALAFLGLAFSAFSQASISTERLRKDVAFLASDKLRGRGTATKDEQKAAKFLAKQFQKIGLEPRGDDGFFHRFEFRKGTDPHGLLAPDDPLVRSQNVCAFLDNGAATTVIFGAHYDHLGLGKDKNSLDANPEGKIHNGADDNASGTAGLLELARFFKNNGKTEAHNFLFLAFSGEELGLIGSKKWTERPTIDLATVDFMINMDMIGRLDPEKKSLLIGGVGTSPTWVPLLDGLKSDAFSVKKDSAGVGPSDHTSFYLKNLPVLFFFSGQHSDYHKPTDDTEKINFEGQKAILEYVVRVVETVEKTASAKLVFQETRSPDMGRTTFKVTLGIMPDYAFDGVGVHIDGVTDGKPASRAGLKKGDVIIGLGPIEVKTMQDYMKALGMFNKGDATKVRVLRGSEKLENDVTF